MSDAVPPRSRPEEPASRPEHPKHTVPDDSPPGVCVHRKGCLARYTRSKGGMGRLLGGLVFQWVMCAVVWTLGVIWWWGPPGFAVVSVVTLALVAALFAGYHRRGHRGWCRVLRSLDLGEVAEVVPLGWIARFFTWILGPFGRIGRLVAWVGRFLSSLRDL
ncbi:hypothetical protein [Rhizohabitans arisaemae]|uniref:hypothetical protein n=1 Tax=Rhizohabitans arisaemae TaxID=2720610 RepID=UPI0024B15689|nr:hypothetical protein [Rhizohabitans arisaemae]